VTNVEREDVTFTSGGARCAAWLYRPDSASPSPVVVMAHGFTGTREIRLDAYAERFCAAGLGALVFDYRHFGASEGEPRQLLDIEAQHDDYRAAIAFARGLEWADPARIALFGTSFSGGHVVPLAAEDRQIAALVAQCPFSDGPASLRALGPAAALRLTLPGLRDQLRALRGRPPYYIRVVGPPGSRAVMATPDSEPGFRALLPQDSLWEDRVAARIALRIGTYRPGRAAERVSCPALFCVCDGDSLAPARTTVRNAERAPRAVVKRYPIGHFEIYVGEWFERAVADQTEFLVEHLLGTGPQGSSAEKVSQRAGSP
jgi:pimeloyl-ACP methyl ester carboxylesterase